MNSTRSRGLLERGPAADLWRRTLSQIPSVFGRLVYLCSLRDPNTDRYAHFGLEQSVGQERAERVLRDSHRAVFSEWLDQTLEQQMTDLDLYLASLAGERSDVVAAWTRLAPYRNLPPSSTREIERDLYLADLETILGLLRNQHGIAPAESD